MSTSAPTHKNMPKPGALAQNGFGDGCDNFAALVYRCTSEGILVVDPKGYILDVNPAFVRHRGKAPHEVVGQHLKCLNSKCHDYAFYKAMWDEVQSNGSWQGEHWAQRANGELYPEWLSINTAYGASDEVCGRVLIFSNIAEIKRAHAIIWKQANFDSLTGLPNRQMFVDRLEQAIIRAKRGQMRLGLLFLNLDRFKEVNDILGHATGDELIREAARRIVACVRQSDTVARLGGDEFTVLLENIQETKNVQRLTREILHKFAVPFRFGNETVYLSTSIGISFFPDDAQTAEMLLNNADQAVSAAKSLGRNRCSYFTRSMQEQAQKRMRLANELHAALAQQQLSLHYQPIIDIKSGGIAKVETLLRWQHPLIGMVPPDEFIPLAEETGIIREIGNWVFEQATRQLQQWQRSLAPDLKICLNISPVQLRKDGIDLGYWKSHLDSLGLWPKDVILEITEGVFIDTKDDGLHHLLNDFKALGFEISLDDFGTGYASLAYLRKLKTDILKIDRLFVENIVDDSQDYALCQAVISLAQTLGIKVVAEGVEAQPQLDLLSAAGCDYAQGFLISRPLPAEAFAALLAQARQ